MPAPTPRGRALARPVAVALALAISAVALTPLAGATATAAGPAPTVFDTESFAGTSAPTFVTPAGPGGGPNSACLLAGTSSDSSVRGCDPTAPAVDGSGRLRLTDVAGGQSGGVSSVRGIPSGQGLEVSFDTYTYGGNGADGLTFFLTATDPENPQPPAMLGQPGGSLGYAGPGGNTGLPNAYLGVGIDTYGNFSTQGADGSGCTGAPGYLPSHVVVRGPGNGSTGYCYLLGADGGQLRADDPTAVPVHIVLNPTANTVVDSTGQSVAAGWGRVDWTPIGGVQRSLSGPLPSTHNGGIPAGLYPDSWIDADTGIPWKLMYGWSGGTGGAIDAHEISDLRSSSLAGPVVQLQLTSAGAGTAQQGSTGSVTLTTSIAGSPDGESLPIGLTALFPAGVTPQLPDDEQRNGVWNQCAIAGRQLTCQAADTSPFPLGAGLPLTVPYSVAPDALLGLADVSATVISKDAEASTTRQTIAITKPTARIAAVASPVDGVYGTGTGFQVTGLPEDATGTVDFFLDGQGEPICSATLPTTSCTAPSALDAGPHELTASWSGDDDWGASDSPTTVFTIAKAGVTATVSASPATVAFGGTSTLALSGLPDDATGAVTFVDAEGAVLCTTTAATPSCVTSDALAPGARRVTGTWPGDGNHDEVTTSDIPFTVERIPTTPQVQPDATAPYLTSRTFTISGVPADATGSVLVATASGTAICTVTLPAATCSSAATLPGTVQVTAAYDGDTRYAPGGSASVPFTVIPIATTDDTVVPGVESTALRLSWPAVAGTEHYRVRIASVSTPDASAQTIDAGAATSTTVTRLTADTEYDWTVSAFGPDDVQLATLAYRASTAAAPAPVQTAGSGATPAGSVQVGPVQVPAPLATPARAVLAATGTSAALPVLALGALALLVGCALLLLLRRRQRRPSRR